MSVTRILCEKCKHPLAWCACKKPGATSVAGPSESRPRSGALRTGELVRKGRSYVERRFQELVAKRATRTATPADLAKLDRYRRLRRELNGTAYETAEQARIRYASTRVKKRLKGLIHSARSNK